MPLNTCCQPENEPLECTCLCCLKKALYPTEYPPRNAIGLQFYQKPVTGEWAVSYGLHKFTTPPLSKISVHLLATLMSCSVVEYPPRNPNCLLLKNPCCFRWIRMCFLMADSASLHMVSMTMIIAYFQIQPVDKVTYYTKYPTIQHVCLLGMQASQSTAQLADLG